MGGSTGAWESADATCSFPSSVDTRSISAFEAFGNQRRSRARQDRPVATDPEVTLHAEITKSNFWGLLSEASCALDESVASDSDVPSEYP